MRLNTVLPRIHRYAGIGEDDHFHEKGFMVSIPACQHPKNYLLFLILSLSFKYV